MTSLYDNNLRGLLAGSGITARQPARIGAAWSAKSLIDFVTQCFYQQFPGVYCCYLNDAAKLLKIELMAVGEISKMNFRHGVIAERSKRYGATGIVMGYSDPNGAPFVSHQPSRLKQLARDLEEQNVTLIELIRISPAGIDRYPLS